MSLEDIAQLEPDPLEIEPRLCEWCGCAIDQHRMVDTGEGPIFYCPDLSPDEMTLPELERRAELIRQIEVAEIMARMEATDGPFKAPPPAEPRPYRTPQATIDAFWYVVRLADPERLAAWLDDHPKDEFFLLNLLEGK